MNSLLRSDHNWAHERKNISPIDILIELVENHGTASNGNPIDSEDANQLITALKSDDASFNREKMKGHLQYIVNAMTGHLEKIQSKGEGSYSDEVLRLVKETLVDMDLRIENVRYTRLTMMISRAHDIIKEKPARPFEKKKGDLFRIVIV